MSGFATYTDNPASVAPPAHWRAMPVQEGCDFRRWIVAYGPDWTLEARARRASPAYRLDVVESGGPGPRRVYEGDDWRAVLYAASEWGAIVHTADQARVTGLAARFSAALRAALSPAHLEAVRATPRPTPYGGCPTHDYVDANVVMGEAFEAFMGRASDVASQADADLWNRAWSLASHRDFRMGEVEGAVRRAPS